MFAFFAKAPAPFKPILAPLSLRQPRCGGCNEQTQSPLFGKLPAEIRNDVYRYVFTGEARELLSIEAHPLSLLLTCHRASNEATALAFSCHAFQVARHLNLTTFVTLSNALAHLFPHQKDGITALSYDLGSGYFRPENASAAGSLLINAILLLPNFSRFELRLLRGWKGRSGIHRDFPPPWCYTYEDARNQAAQTYAPLWFLNQILGHPAELHTYAWQAGQRWEADWPQYMDDQYLDVVDACDWNGNPCFKPSMSHDAVGKVRGVHMCPCPCGEVSWTSADLIQETGRRISIDTTFYGPEERLLPPLSAEAALKARLGPKAVILREGNAPLQVAQGQADFFGTGTKITSVAYAGDDMYWESFRRKNGDWRAIARGLWRGTILGMSEDACPGSWSLGEGDWARIKEMAESRMPPEIVASENLDAILEDSKVASDTRHTTREVC